MGDAGAVVLDQARNLSGTKAPRRSRGRRTSCKNLSRHAAARSLELAEGREAAFLGVAFLGDAARGVSDFTSMAGWRFMRDRQPVFHPRAKQTLWIALKRRLACERTQHDAAHRPQFLVLCRCLAQLSLRSACFDTEVGKLVHARVGSSPLDIAQSATPTKAGGPTAAS